MDPERDLRRRRGGALGRAVLVAGSATLAVALLEGGLRLAPSKSRIAIESAPLAATSLGPLIEPDSDARIVFRLKPNVSVPFLGTTVRTSSLGFRGAELCDGGTFRIVGIGDSVMFGWGVEEEETYLHRAGELLRPSLPDVETVNLGVPGYNTIQELALLERHVVDLQPAWVALGFIGNDFEATRAVPGRRSLLERHSYLYRLVARRSRAAWPDPSLDARMEAVYAAVHRLGELSRSHGFRTLVTFYTSTNDPHTTFRELPHPRVHAICRQEGFAVVDFQRLLLDAMERGEATSLPDVWLHAAPPFDPHPNVRGHELFARGVAQEIAAAP
ncbi:MAG: SGNH/GDSL hydrolase family protein [Acidobacteriota bacterium]